MQDVRIPYQQKRMFGFVTFVYPETVKLILARGNPHFICDSRVLVKPYKEKGKIVEKYGFLSHLLVHSVSSSVNTGVQFVSLTVAGGNSSLKGEICHHVQAHLG